MTSKKLIAALLLILAQLGIVACSSVTTGAEAFPVKIAKQEARRHGWKQMNVGSCVYRDGYWHVYLVKRPFTVEGDAMVKISPEGTVVQFLPAMSAGPNQAIQPTPR